MELAGLEEAQKEVRGRVFWGAPMERSTVYWFRHLACRKCFVPLRGTIFAYVYSRGSLTWFCSVQGCQRVGSQGQAPWSPDCLAPYVFKGFVTVPGAGSGNGAQEELFSPLRLGVAASDQIKGKAF